MLSEDALIIMMMILFVLLLAFVLNNTNQHLSVLPSGGLSQQEASLYLYFNEKDKNQVVGYAQSNSVVRVSRTT